jgi:hypothetical protein
MQKLFTLRSFLFVCLASLFGTGLMAQPNTISLGGTYSQNFDNMLRTATAVLPTGWKTDENTNPRTLGIFSAAQNHTDFIAGANMANPLTGGAYNFGAGTTADGNGDRALGGLNTSSNPTSVNVYFALQNTGLTSISDFVVSYSIEKYRNGKNNDGSAVQLYYSKDGTTWFAASTPTLYAADANNDGFSPAPDASQTKFVVNAGVSPTGGIAAGATLYLAWNISTPVGTPGANASNSIALGIDDVTIRTGTGGISATAYYFRSVATGNWSDGNTWEYSADDITWSPAPAPHSPDFNDYTITVRSPNTVTVTADVTTDQTIVNSGGTLTVGGSQTLTLNDGTGFDLSVDGTANGAGNLLITSTSLGTASIGTSSGTISVNSTVQRYIPALRAWRFLSAPVAASDAPTINAAWQEGAGGTIADPHPGFGTHITGGSTGNGFDQNSVNNPSLKYYSTASGTATDETKWTGISSTNIAITGQQGYMLFVRGSRATDLTLLAAAPTSNTTLRENGTLKTSDQTIGLASSVVYTVVGNPYAAPIDIYNLAKTNGSTNVADNYYIWDPKMTGTYGVGAYVNISWNGSSYDFTPAPTSPVSRMVQSGEAFFATTVTAAAGTLIIKESDKLASGSDNVFRVASASVHQNIRTNLYVVNANGSTNLLDGTLNSYSSSFSNAIDQYDSRKLTNFGENIAIVRDGQTFIVERRQSIGDPINLKIWQMQQQNYQLQIVAENVDNTTGLTAFLNDSYLKTSTQINLSGTTSVNFSITADAASAATNRFSISFNKPGVVPASGNAAIVVYPNPVTNGVINLQMNNMPAGNYNVRVFNSMGQTILVKFINRVAGSSTETIQLGKGFTKGVYQLDVVKPDNSKFSSKVIAN